MRKEDEVDADVDRGMDGIFLVAECYPIFLLRAALFHKLRNPDTILRAAVGLAGLLLHLIGSTAVMMYGERAAFFNNKPLSNHVFLNNIAAAGATTRGPSNERETR